MFDLLLLVSVFFGGTLSVDDIQQQAVIVADTLDFPRPWLEKHAYMDQVYIQATQAGATPLQISRLHEIACTESNCGNPRVCGRNGCGPFQHLVRTLVPKGFEKVRLAKRVIAWLLTNKPGYVATTALDLLRGCEELSGEYWRCCYGGAYRPSCRIKWDERYREKKLHQHLEQTNAYD